MRRFDLLVVGELNVDLVMRDDDPVPQFGQQEKLYRDAELDLGSASAIMACQASKLGLRTAIAGKIGDDLFGRMVTTILSQQGVDTSGVVIDPAVKTGITVHLSGPSDRAMLTFMGSMAAFSATEVSSELLTASRHLHVSSVFLQPMLRPGLSGLLTQAHAAQLTTSLDPGWDPSGRWELADLLPQIDVFFPNQKELRQITREEDPLCGAHVVGRAVPVVAVKLGAQGGLGVHGEQQHLEPAFPITTVVDSTGAGDSFNAGFLARYLDGRPLQECLRWGCICGSLVVTHMGGIAGQPSAAQVAALASAS